MRGSHTYSERRNSEASEYSGCVADLKDFYRFVATKGKYLVKVCKQSNKSADTRAKDLRCQIKADSKSAGRAT